MNDMVKNLFLWLVIAIVLVSVFSNFGPRHAAAEKIAYSQFLTEIDQGMIHSVTVEDNKIIKGSTKNNRRFVTYMPVQDNALLGQLLKNNVTVTGQEKPQESFLLHLFINWFPMLLLIGVWIFFMRQMQGGGGKGAMSFGKSKAR
ncbi:MAG TPA: ATP-dependent metalloprotease, partial [Legionellales bacterium]|nr:ATP-dependent metalloprotease [Legionellales bacterium]